VVETHATPDKAEQILANPFYQAVSSSFAGTQEYMAMEKLGQLRTEAERDGTWDLIVVDTPPSRSALDFLDAPRRLGSFLDGRFVRLLMAPAKAGGRAYLKVFSAGVDLAQRTVSRVLGGQLLADVQTFVAALDTMFGGFRERADVTYALLKEDTTAFVVVASPDRDALREAAFFVDRLGEERMPLAGVVVNRVQALGASSLSASRAEDGVEQLLESGHGETLTAGLLALHADLAATASRQHAVVTRFAASHPDVHDLDGLREVGRLLAG
jgi:anion-transporting  ArsA/GET3 family ATPase